MSKLRGELRAIEEIVPAEREQMYSLLASYFEQTNREQFASDLSEKQYCVLLRDSERGAIQGFSTLQQLESTIDGRPAVAIFSGDTIVDRHYWGATELIKIWAEHVFGLAQRVEGKQVYWFLITSGFRTYRFLPVFFREFFPCYQLTTPAAIQNLLDALGEKKFPGEYCAQTGVIRLARPAPLLQGVSDVTAGRLEDPHIEFFVRANPGHANGDELACITRIDYENLTRAGRRLYPASLAGTPTQVQTISVGPVPTGSQLSGY